MQAPKESLDAAIAANWATAQADPPPVQDPSFVTGNSRVSPERMPPLDEVVANRVRSRTAKAHEDSFARGMREGTDPYIFASGRPSVNSDAVFYRMGKAEVTVSGLEMLQATDPEALGYAKGQELKRLYLAGAEAQPVPSGYFDGPPNPPGQGLCRSEREGLAQDIGMGSKRDMPPPLLQMTISTQFLSEVLHELAGMASMCWTQPPKGVFDSTRCLDAVAHALKRLAPEPSPNRVHVEPDNDAVICPACAHQFGAIPVNVQQELAHYRAQQDAKTPGQATPLQQRTKTG
jgi:hypothetical protein